LWAIEADRHVHSASGLESGQHEASASPADTVERAHTVQSWPPMATEVHQGIQHDDTATKQVATTIGREAAVVVKAVSLRPAWRADGVRFGWR
jgi:hypothetical protein